MNHPDLLRIPDEELVAPRISAAVQVESQEEWNKVVAHLVAAGMLEREVPSETLRYKDEAVRNGAFGVHKKWVLKEDGSWLKDPPLDHKHDPWQQFSEENAHQSL